MILHVSFISKGFDERYDKLKTIHFQFKKEMDTMGVWICALCGAWESGETCWEKEENAKLPCINCISGINNNKLNKKGV